MALLLFFSLLLVSVKCKVYFHEKVDDGFLGRWVQSTSTSVPKHGSLTVVKSEFEDDEFFVKTSEDSSYYQYGSMFEDHLDTAKNTLVFQYVVFHAQSLDCGGSYVKFYGADTDFKSFDGNTPYFIMFGPDFCGYSTKKIHCIVNHGGKNNEITPEVSTILDKKPHLLSLILHTNKTFQIYVDEELKRNGTLAENFSILPPRMIPDPKEKKPEDWVDEQYIPDPNEEKPKDWVELKTIVDPNATKPGDWNDDTDGEWQPDSIPNPDYKGDWEAKTIENPAYKGEWKAKEIQNPDFKEDTSIGNFKVKGIALEIWQVKSGTHFDEFYVSDDLEEAKAHSRLVLDRLKKISNEIDNKEIAERERLSKEQKEENKSLNDDEADEDVDDDEPNLSSSPDDAKSAADEDFKSEL